MTFPSAFMNLGLLQPASSLYVFPLTFTLNLNLQSQTSLPKSKTSIINTTTKPPQSSKHPPHIVPALTDPSLHQQPFFNNMPRGRIDPMARGMTGRENLDLSYLADPASEMSRGEGISGRYRAGRPRGHDSERGEPRIAGSRGYGDHRATRGGDVSDSGSDLADSTDDDDDDDDDSLAGESARPRFGRTRRQRGAVGYDYGSPDGHSLAGESAAAARRFGGSSRRRRRRRHRGTRGGSPDSSSSSLSSSDDDDDDNDSSAQAPARPRPAGTPRAHRARALPHSRRTIASRTMHHLSDSDSDSSPSDESTDDEASAPRRGGGAASGHRHGARSSRPVAMYPGGDAGSVDFLDSEAGFGGRDTGRSQYGSRRAPGPYGRYAGGGGV